MSIFWGTVGYESVSTIVTRFLCFGGFFGGEGFLNKNFQIRTKLKKKLTSPRCSSAPESGHEVRAQDGGVEYGQKLRA